MNPYDSEQVVYIYDVLLRNNLTCKIKHRIIHMNVHEYVLRPFNTYTLRLISYEYRLIICKKMVIYASIYGYKHKIMRRDIADNKTIDQTRYCTLEAHQPRSGLS